MLITHTYLGTTLGEYRCLFFLLLEDYVENQRAIRTGLDERLERFARLLGKDAALVKAFQGDIGVARTDVLAKNWPDEWSEEIMRTPSLLMIDEDFDAFDPRRHQWLHIRLGDREVCDVDGVLNAIVDVISSATSLAASNNLFDEISTRVNRVHRGEALSRVRIRLPLGLSISLRDADDALRSPARVGGRPVSLMR